MLQDHAALSHQQGKLCRIYGYEPCKPALSTLCCPRLCMTHFRSMQLFCKVSFRTVSPNAQAKSLSTSSCPSLCSICFRSTLLFCTNLAGFVGFKKISSLKQHSDINPSLSQSAHDMLRQHTAFLHSKATLTVRLYVHQLCGPQVWSAGPMETGLTLCDTRNRCAWYNSCPARPPCSLRHDRNL